MSKRLNDTAAVSALPAFGGDKFAGERHESHSVHTRRVENGYVTREHHSDADGYREREYVHATEEPKAAGSSDCMRRAVSYMNRNDGPRGDPY